MLKMHIKSLVIGIFQLEMFLLFPKKGLTTVFILGTNDNTAAIHWTAICVFKKKTRKHKIHFFFVKIRHYYVNTSLLYLRPKKSKNYIQNFYFVFLNHKHVKTKCWSTMIRNYQQILIKQFLSSFSHYKPILKYSIVHQRWGEHIKESVNDRKRKERNS